MKRDFLRAPLALSLVLHAGALSTAYLLFARNADTIIAAQDPVYSLTITVSPGAETDDGTGHAPKSPDFKPQPAAHSQAYSKTYSGARAEAHPVAREPRLSSDGRLRSLKDMKNPASPGESVRPAQPGTPSGSAGAASGNTELTAYFMRVRQQIQSHLEYPSTLRARRLQGRVGITIAIEPNGSLRTAEISGSSNHPELDRIALESARTASPFEPFNPRSGEPSTRSARISIEFSIR